MADGVKSQKKGVESHRSTAIAPALAALGIVYGDLGTSPLYTMQTVTGSLGGQASADAALGILSLILWTLIITISLKYCFFVMRADNQGEGGIMALMSLVGMNDWRRGTYVGASMALLGAALIYGDGIITPAISVLSALEGVKGTAPTLTPFVLPLGVAILAALFVVQRFGTATIGKAFGPVMLVWFFAIGLLGLMGVMRHPAVLAAINPWFGLHLLWTAGPGALLLLGGVFLCATGGEALYADMGHFGRGPIRVAWYGLVLPSLVLSYAGQAGQILDGVAKGSNPFFLLCPSWASLPLVGLATVATIIASQAIITGAFSMTRQAMQLGWLPGFEIRQTSDQVYGQIYVPAINVLMAIGTIMITLVFRSSDRLAGAYGTAVATTMVLTTLLLTRAMSKVWRWPIGAVGPLAALFLMVDVGFFAANLTKIVDGGWIPLTLGLVIFTIMVVWRMGVQALRLRLASLAEPLEQFLGELESGHIARVPGVAIFLTRPTDKIPAFVGDYVRKMGSLHKVMIALHIRFEEVPRVDTTERCSITKMDEGLWHVTLRYGFFEAPDLIQALRDFKGAPVDLQHAVFFTSREIIVVGKHSTIAKWRVHLFVFLYRNASRLTERFNLPADRTVEVSRIVRL